MRSIVLTAFFLAMISNAFSQFFPPPEAVFLYSDNDSLYLSWQKPVNGSPESYKIFYHTYWNGQRHHIASTSDTSFIIALPTFWNSVFIGVSSYYTNPQGESDTIWNAVQWLSVLTFPQVVNFEYPNVYSMGLVTNPSSLYSDWVLTDSTYFSEDHSVTFRSDSINSRSSLIAPYLHVIPLQIPVICIMCKIPQSQGYSDTLKFQYYTNGNWIAISESLFSIDDWQLVTISLETLPSSFDFALEAISGGGQGVHIDDVMFEYLTMVAPEKPDPMFINVFPNPTNNGSITINLDNPHNLYLTCFNTFGQQIHQQEILSAENVINVSTWQPGIYLAVIYADGKTVGQAKFVVQ